MELEEIAAYLNVCEGLVKVASRVHDIPVETNTGRPRDDGSKVAAGDHTPYADDTGDIDAQVD